MVDVSDKVEIVNLNDPAIFFMNQNVSIWKREYFLQC